MYIQHTHRVRKVLGYQNTSSNNAFGYWQQEMVIVVLLLPLPGAVLLMLYDERFLSAFESPELELMPGIS